MSVNIPQIGNVRLIPLDLTTANLTTVYAPTNANIRGVFESMSFCNDSAGSVNITVILTDGTSTWKLYDVHPVAAHATELFKEHPFPITAGWTLAVQAGTANALHVITVISEQTSTR